VVNKPVVGWFRENRQKKPEDKTPAKPTRSQVEKKGVKSLQLDQGTDPLGGGKRSKLLVLGCCRKEDAKGTWLGGFFGGGLS